MTAMDARPSSRCRTVARTWVAAALLAACGALRAQVPAAPGPASPLPPASAPEAAQPQPVAAPVSLSARKVYEQARSQLVQLRTVLKGRASQTSVGSGFLVSADGLIVSNFHVVAQAALEPERHDIVYVTADGREARAEILQLDVLHDLALLRAGDARAGEGQAARTFDVLPFRPAEEPLAQGERIYSLGNPLDVGFAVTQGTYNGLVKRSFYPQIFFGGALSGGMSGGPALDEQGRVVGINVARRVDGEQVSFLVPAMFATALIARGKDAKPLAAPAWAIVGTQLEQHQQALVDRFVKQGFKDATHPRYRVPVPPDEFMRCWGTSEESRTGGLDFERSECAMDTRIFVGDYTTGTVSLRHESYDGRKLGTLRFADRHAQSFRNEGFVRLPQQHQTRPRCHEGYVERDGLPLRTVVCLRAYRKLPKLYDVAVLVATLDQNQAGVQGRLDAQGVSWANAERLVRHYLDGYGWAAGAKP